MKKEEIKQRIVDKIEKTEKLIVEYRNVTVPVSNDDAIGRISSINAIKYKKRDRSFVATSRIET